MVSEMHHPPVKASARCHAPPALRVTPSTDDVVCVHGELDLATAPRLVDSLRHASFASGGALTVDLSELTFCGCAGLSVLLTEHSRRLAIGSSLVLASPSRQVRRILALTGLDAVFNIRARDGDVGPHDTTLPAEPAGSQPPGSGAPRSDSASYAAPEPSRTGLLVQYPAAAWISTSAAGASMLPAGGDGQTPWTPSAAVTPAK